MFVSSENWESGYCLPDHDPLASSIGQIIGSGQGRGIGLLLISMSTLLMLATAIGSLYPRLRLVEDELPDIEQTELNLNIES